MTPEDIKRALESRGWTAEIVSQSEVSDLVDVTSDGLMKCVDGRPSDLPGMNGPKTLGGVYAIASLRNVRDLDGLTAIVNEVRAAGHEPSVHGDCHPDHPEKGCGFFKLWSAGDLDGLEPPTYSAQEAKDAVLAAGGHYESLQGDHEERTVMINLVANKTLEPKAESQRFVVDGWAAGAFDLDVPRYVTLAAQTVELLSTLRTATIIVP